jgi:hypothetical protein
MRWGRLAVTLAVAALLLPVGSAWASESPEPSPSPSVGSVATPSDVPSASSSPSSSSPAPSPVPSPSVEPSSSPTAEVVLVGVSGDLGGAVQAIFVLCLLSMSVLVVHVVGSWGRHD